MVRIPQPDSPVIRTPFPPYSPDDLQSIVEDAAYREQNYFYHWSFGRHFIFLFELHISEYME